VSPPQKLVIIDGSSLIYRAFFALPPLVTVDGTPTNAVYGFTTMLLSLLEQEHPHIVLVAFEGGRTFRHDDFAEYKAHRPRTPDELAVQGPLAREVIEAFGIPILQHSGYEADDVIGTITRRAAAAGFEVLGVTGDLDLLQLVGPEVKVLVNRRGVSEATLYDEAAVRERFGLDPVQLPDYKALKGDSSDNIPGIPGVGDKTATALISQYGSLESLLAHAEEVKAAKVRGNLIAGREKAALYKKLTTIVTDLPLETPFEAWAYPGPDAPRLRELFNRLEFRTLAGRLPALLGDDAPPVEAAADRIAWRRLEAGPELDAWLDGARALGRAGLHSLQTGGVLQAVALSAGGDTVVLGADESDSADGGEGLFAGAADPWAPPPALRAALEATDLEVRAHDLKREAHALGVEFGRPGFDTLLAAYVLNPGRASYRLNELSREHLRRDLGEGEPLELLARRALAVEALAEPLRERLAADELDRVYEELELPLVPILGRMETLGVAVNRDELRGLSARLAERVAAVEEEAHALVGRRFNLGSPKQLQDLLFVELELPAGRKTKTGYSTDSDVLLDAAAQTGHPLPGLILEWRELSKLKSTYADALQNLIAADGRVHTHLNQTVAATGRLSSSDPNLQNIPIRTEIGREIRAAFVAAPGMRLLCADYSQIELRIMAHICKDPELVRAFAEDRDVHVATAARVFGVPPEAVTADQRRSAKTVNFAVLYGQREYGLSRQLRIPISDARDLVKAYFEQFPGVLRYVDETLDHCRKWGFVTTLPPYRRKRYIPGIHAGNRNERLAAEREAMNAPVQGTAADIIKVAMLRVDAAMRQAGGRSRMILQVHDELLFEVPPDEEAAMRSLVKREMESAYPLDVPLRVDTKVGDNWRDAESG
jgi:DNA polymerase-1